MVLDYKNAKEKLIAGSGFDSLQFFISNGYFLEAGYYYLLHDDLDNALKIFNSLKEKDIRAHWACIMVSFINGMPCEYPTYFELRNFLEIDLNILIRNFKGNYAEKIIRYADYMFNINPETYKFIGRVLYNNKLEEAATYYLKCAKSYFYNDPELHYLIAFIDYNNKDFESAKKALIDCLHILPDYFPAVNMLNLLNENYS